MIAELVGDVSANGLDDEQTVKVAIFKERWCVRGELVDATDYRQTSQFAPEPFSGGTRSAEGLKVRLYSGEAKL